MPLKYPGIPEPTSEPRSQLATLQALKQVVELLAANATGTTGSQGVSAGSQIFALKDEVKQQLLAVKASLGDKIDQGDQSSKWSVEDAREALIKDISESREQAIKARTYAKGLIDDFENGTFKQTIFDVNQSIDDTKGQVITEAGVRANADGVLSGRVDKVMSAWGANDATYTNTIVSFANKTNAVTTGYEKFAASNGWAGSNIENWSVAITGPTGAIATQVNNLKAEVLGTDANGNVDPKQGKLSTYLLNELNLVTDVNKKIATGQQLQNLISQTTDPNNKNSLQAQVTQEATTRAAFQGKVTSRYVVTASASSGGVTAISGLELISDASSNTPISEFNITADKFNLYHPSYGKKAVMTVQTVNGTPTLGIAGDIVADGTIKARHMAFDSVTANSIQAGAISADKIKAGTITADKIAAGTITGDKIAANTIAATSLTANSITADKIAAGTITADKLVVGGIDFAQLAANAVSNTTISAGYGSSTTSTIFLRAGARVSIFATYAGGDNLGLNPTTGTLSVSASSGGVANSSISIRPSGGGLGITTWNINGVTVVTSVSQAYNSNPTTLLSFMYAPTSGSYNFTATASSGFGQLVSIMAMELAR